MGDPRRPEQKRRRALDGLLGAALRLFKSHSLLDLMEEAFDGPAVGVVRQDLLQGERQVGRVEKLRPSSASGPARRDDADRPLPENFPPQRRPGLHLVMSSVGHLDRPPVLRSPRHALGGARKFPSVQLRTANPLGPFRTRRPQLRIIPDAADDLDAFRQSEHQVVVGIIPVHQQHDAPSGQPFGELFDHLQGQLSLGLEAHAPLTAQRLAPIQPRQDRHGKDVVFPQRHAHQHAGDDPSQPPLQLSSLLRLGPVVIDHARAVDFRAGLLLRGLVDGHLDPFAVGQQILAQEPHQLLPESIHLPACLAEKPVEPRMMRRANPRRQNHPRHGVPPLHQHRAGEQQRKHPERRLRERHRKIRQESIDRHRQRDRIVPDNLIDSQGPALQYLAQFTHWHDTDCRAFFLSEKCETIG